MAIPKISDTGGRIDTEAEGSDMLFYGVLTRSQLYKYNS